MFKVNNKDKEQRNRRGSGVFIINFEHLFVTLFSSVSTVEYEQAIETDNSRTRKCIEYSHLTRSPILLDNTPAVVL